MRTIVFRTLKPLPQREILRTKPNDPLRGFLVLSSSAFPLVLSVISPRNGLHVREKVVSLSPNGQLMTIYHHLVKST